MNMTEVKTAELVGAALDWAVGHVEKVFDEEPWHYRKLDGRIWCNEFSYGYDPSRNWEVCGPLIVKYDVSMFRVDKETVGAEFEHSYLQYESQTIDATGETYLIAACRAIVAAKLGDVVSVPSELLEVGE